MLNQAYKTAGKIDPTRRDMYIVSQKWTDAGEKRRDTFKHFERAEKYDFSVD